MTARYKPPDELPASTDESGGTHPEQAYLGTVAELKELARTAPHVTQELILTVASMEPVEMRRRLIRQADWFGHFAHSLDGIAHIRHIPGAAPDGCWSHKEVRSVVLKLVAEINSLNLAEEGAKEAFGVVVQDKRDLEAAVSRLQGLLESAYEMVKQHTQHLRYDVQRKTVQRAVVDVKPFETSTGLAGRKDHK